MRKNSLTLAHLPTLLLVIGYAIYWLEMFWHHDNYGQTTPIAWILAGGLILVSLVNNRVSIQQSLLGYKEWFASLSRAEKGLIGVGILFSLIILGISLAASIYPPHLSQEYDALNYHISLPRQHLITNSFAHIPWSTADLMPLPLDFALAPFWLATVLPNKVIHFVFLVGLLGIVISLGKRLGIQSFWANTLLVFVILGSHGLGIQFGVAMLDLIMAYLFVAAVDSCLKGDWKLAAIEICFYAWSKSFTLCQILILIGALVALVWIARKAGFLIKVGFEAGQELMERIPRFRIGRFSLLFLVLSAIIAGPFVVKSLEVAKTPLYPFYPGIINVIGAPPREAFMNKLHETVGGYIGFRDVYGHGRTVVAFIKHLWLLAVPEQGVNNAYDYPLGLPYLIFVIPFLYFFVQSIRKRQFPLVPTLILLYWAGWWWGSQQARFFYIPLLLIFVTALPQLKMNSKVLCGVIVLALMLNTVSLARAHKHLLGKTAWETLRPEDRAVMETGIRYIREKRKDTVAVQNKEVAFARFPVMVTKEELPFVVAVDQHR